MVFAVAEITFMHAAEMETTILRTAWELETAQMCAMSDMGGASQPEFRDIPAENVNSLQRIYQGQTRLVPMAPVKFK